MKILVTGATGKFGSIVIDRLREKMKASDLIVSVRNPEKARHLAEAGVEVRQGDFDQPDQLVETFQGVDKLLLISTDGDNETRIRQHLAAVGAAKKAKVGYIAYTSVVNADDSKLSLAQVHRVTEEAIKATGIPNLILRNNWYLENEASSIQGAENGSPWISAAKKGKVGWALRREYAQAAANALLESESESKVYEFSGPLRSQKELTEAVERVIGKPVTFLVELLSGIQKAIGEKALEAESNDLIRLLGQPLVDLETAIGEVRKSYEN